MKITNKNIQIIVYLKKNINSYSKTTMVNRNTAINNKEKKHLMGGSSL